MFPLFIKECPLYPVAKAKTLESSLILLSLFFYIPHSIHLQNLPLPSDNKSSHLTNPSPHQQYTRVLSSPHTSSLTLVVCLFENSHSNRCELIAHCGIDCMFLLVSGVGIFSCTCWHLHVFFGEVSVQSLCPFLIRLLVCCFHFYPAI